MAAPVAEIPIGERGVSLQQKVQTASGAKPASRSIRTGVPSYTCSLNKKSHTNLQRTGQSVLRLTRLTYRATELHLAPVHPLKSSAC